MTSIFWIYVPTNNKEPNLDHTERDISDISITLSQYIRFMQFVPNRHIKH